MLAGVTILIALVSEIFVESVQEAALTFGMTDGLRGFYHRGAGRRRGGNGVGVFRARKNRLDLSVGIALGRRPRSPFSWRRCWCCSATSSGRPRWTSNSGPALSS